MKSIYVIAIVLLFSLNLISQDFEGIIIYERMPNSRGNISIEKYYFGKNKLRIDKETIDSNVYYSTSVYDFDAYTNYYMRSNNGDRFEIKNISLSYLDSIHLIKPDSTLVLDYLCSLIELKFKEGDFGTIQKQRRLVANDLAFNVPEEWIMEYGMVLAKDHRITLYLEEDISSVDFPDTPPRGYSRKAIAVIPMKLPESIFEVENR